MVPKPPKPSIHSNLNNQMCGELRMQQMVFDMRPLDECLEMMQSHKPQLQVHICHINPLTPNPRKISKRATGTMPSAVRITRAR